MVTGVLLMVASLQQSPPPQMSASVDRYTLALGEELLLTIRATTRSDIPPLAVQVPYLDGFELISRSERTEVAFDPDPTRSTVIHIRLRPTRVGLVTIGSAVALQGPHRVETGEIEVEVVDAAGALATTLNPRVARVLNRGPPRNLTGDVALVVLLSSDTVLVGEQVDVVTVAWIPRDLRLRLRRPPTLEPPTVEGMWTYPQPTPVGIAASRMVRGVWYDLFVAHEVVFPLATGDHVIEPAVLRYSVPLALQFFSQEERLSLSSGQATVTARALPERDKPEDFAGAVARSLELSRTVTPSIGRAGEPLTVDVTLAGEGNLSLWPEPASRWPPGVRSYPDQSEERIQPVDGRIAGSKRFRYLVIPDSAGTMLLPPLVYRYYDTRRRRYREATVPAARVAVAPPATQVSSGALPPALLRSSGAPLDTRLSRALPFPVWIVVLLLPIVAYLARRVPWDRLRTSEPIAPLSDDQVIESELHDLLQQMVPDLDEREDHELLEALRMSGVGEDTAERLVHLRGRLREARYGPEPATRPTEALLEEVQSIVSTVRGREAIRGRRATPVGLLVLLSVTSILSAQERSTSPETLYEVGALSAAAEGFRDRVTREPATPEHWYNLGAAHYRLGQEARAAWAWHHALRLAPRNSTVRRGLELVPPPDRVSARLLSVPPITHRELLLLAGFAWFGGWIGLIVKPTWGRRWALALGAALLLGTGAAWIARDDRPPLAIVLHDTQLRVSPHERAPQVANAFGGAVVRLADSTQGWWLVRAPSEQLGWLRAQELARLGDPLAGRQ
ncbi:MAG: hypothetical protein HKM89_04995 [Gemmatimonadales bacterium]|nr:hypothetical protein [Gemmatimonadales bacterium]